MKFPNDIPLPGLSVDIIHGVNSIHRPPSDDEYPPFSKSVKSVYKRLAEPATARNFRVSVHILPCLISAVWKKDMLPCIAVSALDHDIVWDRTAMLEKSGNRSGRCRVSGGNGIQVLYQLPLGSDSVELALWRPYVDQTP